MPTSHASTTPPAPPPGPSIGERLAAARTRRGISYDDAAAATKLSVAYLKAMEANRFDQMPAPIYAKNFIRIYATYLGLDGRQIADEFGRQVTMTVELPSIAKASPVYHLSMLITQIIRHRVILAVMAGALIILLLYLKSAADSEPAPMATNVSDPQLAELLRDYKPMFDATEPLPQLE